MDALRIQVDRSQVYSSLLRQLVKNCDVTKIAHVIDYLLHAGILVDDDLLQQLWYAFTLFLFASMLDY